MLLVLYKLFPSPIWLGASTSWYTWVPKFSVLHWGRMAHIWKVNQGANINYKIKTHWHHSTVKKCTNPFLLHLHRFVQCNEHLRQRGGDTSVIMGILLGNGQMYCIVLPVRADVSHLYWLFMQHECSNNKSAGKSVGQMKVWIFLVLLFTRFQIAQLHHLTWWVLLCKNYVWSISVRLWLR